MLIDCSYFIDGPRHIQNASLGKMPNPNAEEVNAAIKAYIKIFQRPFLKGVLGVTFARSLDTYLKTLDDNEGAEHDMELDMIIEQLREPFANYVFYKILRDGNSQATMTGLVRLKCANDYVSPIRRQVSAWNDMVDMIADFSAWSKSDNCYVSGIETDSNFLTKINNLNL
ncbi:MAG: hypothetical protein HDR87_08480 [Bacteroides sp.]|nr:hypothetical protein [Bacteroides sp.]